MTTPLHVLGLRAENFKRIQLVDIAPDGNVVVLSGKNAQGKTSVMDALWITLGGRAGSTGTDVTNPIRDGQDEASVSIDLGPIHIAGDPHERELRATRTWKRNDAGDVTSTLIVESKDGKLGSPQKVLDALIQHAGFDPLAFSRMSDREQVAALSAVVTFPEGFDPDEHDRVSAAIFAKRTDVNRREKEQRAQVEGMPQHPGAERVDVSAVMEELSATERRNQDRYDLERARDLSRTTADRLAAEVERAQAAHAEELERLERFANQLAKQPEHVDVQPLRDRIATAGDANERVAANERRAQAAAQHAATKAEANDLTKQLDERAKAKAAALASVRMPIAGLSFEDGLVTYLGQPLRQASGAEQVEVSTAIAMSGDPRLRVVTIRDASLLDSEHRAIIERMAADRDWQVWLEVVDESGTGGIIIEDGTNR